MAKGNLYVISGPSGAGKGTIVSELMKRDDRLALSISCTTRYQREGEIDGVHYYFIDKERFQAMIEEGDFLEYAQVFDNFYGTPMSKVEEKRSAGYDVILEIDVQGALQVKKKAEDAKLIFILPPSFEVLRKRLTGRNTETPEQVEKRLAKAEKEMSLKDRYDYTVVNDDLDTAVEEVYDIIKKNRN